MNSKQNAQHIAGLLHMLRNSGWTVDQTIELSDSVKNATPDEVAMALIQFTGDLLRAARSVTLLQLEAATAEAKRDERGGMLQ